MEPMNADKFYVLTETKEVDGKRGKAKIKCWIDENNQYHQKLLNFTPFAWEEENAD